MKNSVRPARPSPAQACSAATGEYERLPDTSGLSLLEDGIDRERGYDPYDTATPLRDVWRSKQKRA